MNLHLLPYILNILVLVPIGLMTLLGGERADNWPAKAGFQRARVYARF